MRVSVAALRGRINGKRGGFLILLAIVFIGIGLSYLQPSAGRSRTFYFLPNWLPQEWLSVVWGLGAVAAIVAAFRSEPRADWIGFATVSLILTGWGFIYMISWIAGVTPTGWYSAVIFWTFMGMVALVSTWANPLNVTRIPVPPPTSVWTDR